jgi:phosphatidylserine decarboxylase
MANPRPLLIWDRRCGKLVEEWMGDSKPTFESEPRRSITQWVKSWPLCDWLVAAYQNTRRSARNIEPFVRRHNIDMNEFEPTPSPKLCSL